MSVIRKLDQDPVVAFHVAYAKLPGSDPVCALFLSQVSYWCSRAEDGVAWITHQAMYDQTGMSRKQQDRAASYWESVGVMTKFIKGIPPKIHYSIDYARLEVFILEEPVGQVDMSERGILDVQNGHHVMSERGKTSNRDSKDSQRLSEEQEQEHPAAPAPSSPEKVSKSKSVMEREASLKERLVEVWNASCTQAKANTRRCLPSCKMFPVGAAPSLKAYMKVYSDDEIVQLVTDGSFKVQRNDFYHERKYSLTNLMRNLDANASLPMPSSDASPAMKAAADLDDWLMPVDCAKNEKEDSVPGRGMILANDHDEWMQQ